eukprot:TRINITY_DN2651_c0_g2_i1.p3 TRINITY_DN2651_c0_g2~~TRINITY_DN2651_c0_g2_i1.p3  ORF type:complete len:148 (+),score=7.66 TRINITY_DN2651_c0_g2_i1:202-645(+)
MLRALRTPLLTAATRSSASLSTITSGTTRQTRTVSQISKTGTASSRTSCSAARCPLYSTPDVGIRTSIKQSSTALLAHRGCLHTSIRHTPTVEEETPRTTLEDLMTGPENQARLDHLAKTRVGSTLTNPAPQEGFASIEVASCADLI